MAEISSNKTIAKNTILLYGRMVLTMLVSLYTTRVILNTLGVIDDGIYNVVGGVVGMVTFLKGTLSGATSRFITYELGRDDKEKLHQTFSAALLVHIILAVALVVVLETAGLWYINHKLNVPADRLFAAKVVYHLSVFAVLFSVTQVPYTASIISHEKMGVFAYISILEAVLKLIICYALVVSPFDKLITYAALVLVVTIGIQMIYRVYCIRHFEECHMTKVTQSGIIRPILTFSGWDLFGTFSNMARDQGVDVILNFFFGPAINSAAGKAGTVCNAVNGLANNFLTAIKPPIVKAYSMGNTRKMEELMIDASKYSYVCLMLFAAPFFFESKFVIDLWLKNPPAYAEVFCSVDLGLAVLSSMFLPLVYGIHASGKIRFMSIVNGAIWLTVVPITYFMLKAGGAPIVPYVVKYFLLVFVVISNFYSIKKNIPEFDKGLYFRKAFIPSIISATIVMAVTYCVYRLFPGPSWWRILSVCATTTITLGVTSFFIVFDKHIREAAIEKVKSILKIGT